jgi:hypothetical protein
MVSAECRETIAVSIDRALSVAIPLRRGRGRTRADSATAERVRVNAVSRHGRHHRIDGLHERAAEVRSEAIPVTELSEIHHISKHMWSSTISNIFLASDTIAGRKHAQWSL